MNNLPAWVLKESINECDCADCPYAIHMSEALLIAWEALEYLSEKRDSNDRPAIVVAKETLRQIKEISK